MKTLLGLLSLVIVLVYGQDQAKQDTQACGKSLGPEELHQVDGDWVLVWMVYDESRSHDDMTLNFTSSHIEIRVQQDNHSLAFHERNLFGGGKCLSFTANMTLPQDHSGHHSLHLHGAMEHEGGEKKPLNDSATAEFLIGSDRTMIMIYRSQAHGDILLFYRREGQHLEVVLDLTELRAMARCLGLTGAHFVEWTYDGLSDFCHKKSALPTLGPQELHQVGGLWALVSVVYDEVKAAEEQIPLLNSSQVLVRVHPDNHGLTVHEQNMVGGKCVAYTFKLSLPQGAQRIYRLDMHTAMRFMDGKGKPITDAATTEFFPSAENVMRLLYRNQRHGPILAMYRRMGRHLGDLQKDLEEHRAMAKYLGLSGGHYEVWVYDGSAEFCDVIPALERP